MLNLKRRRVRSLRLCRLLYDLRIPKLPTLHTHPIPMSTTVALEDFLQNFLERDEDTGETQPKYMRQLVGICCKSTERVLISTCTPKCVPALLNFELEQLDFERNSLTTVISSLYTLKTTASYRQPKQADTRHRIRRSRAIHFPTRPRQPH